MKRIIALILAVLFIAAMLASCGVEGKYYIYSINGEKCSEEEWNKKFNEIVTDDVEYLDELTKEFYQKY